jgi:UPF0716 protein FxsA
MRLLLIAILLLLPIAEGTLLVKLYQAMGAWVYAWLALSTVTGIVLLQEARFSLHNKLARSFRDGQYSLSALIGSGKSVLAGILLIVPGLITDLLAFALLVLPTASAVEADRNKN